uniref:BtpA family membrane complex biogenesis protein n=1 Tax=Pelodiscus sinensis TaxID=13735 RepID=K7GDS2_PELSI|nr:protein C19orf12 homolog isoform X1 [Pelodiscus sinensis]|eukprot:XP_014428060.1 protein C19orf12 homolog isoform X1 [Pelodiscus sinensis]
MEFLKLFGRLKSVVIGMVHVGALPGTPQSSLPLTQITDKACYESEIYKDAGVDGLIVENMHDLPYTVSVGPEITAAMAVISAAVKQTCPHLPLGIQILCSANQQAVAVALAAGLDFIRVEGFVFSHVADEGIINACAGDLLRYRKQIGAQHIQIFADVKKKHSAHALTADVSVSETAKAAELFLADGVVLTGTATGMQADPKELKEVEHAVKIPVLIGSGVTLENARNFLGANALIIGSYFKKDGYWANSVDPDRVKTFMDHMGKLRK